MSVVDDAIGALSTPRSLSDKEKSQLSEVRDAAVTLAEKVVQTTRPGDAQATALARLREVVFWVEDAMRRDKQPN